MASGAPKKKDNDGLVWALIVFLFAIGLSPIALVLLFVKLFGKDENKKQRAGNSSTMRTSTRTTASTTTRATSGTTAKTKKAVKKAMKSPTDKKSTARILQIIGCIVMLFSVMMGWDYLRWFLEGDFYWWSDVVEMIAGLIGGGAMFVAGRNMSRAVKRYTKYLAVMGDRSTITVLELADTLGYTERRVEKDLQKMIDKGYFGGKAYLNVEVGRLFRSSQANEDWKAQQVQMSEPKVPEKSYAGALRNIRRANDAIDDPELSAKIDRLEEIAGRIFQAAEEDPKKRAKIDTFLNYYMPTTQKLLDSYAQFEAAGVEGENLRQAKQRIEDTMDNIVRGFERQLDELYRADALDIDTDIRVMETMLRRDTASVEDDFGTGAVQQMGEE